MKPLLTFLTLFLMLGGVASAKTDWYSLNICETSKISECKNVGKSLYIYMALAKIEVEIGPVVGVVY